MTAARKWTPHALAALADARSHGAELRLVGGEPRVRFPSLPPAGLIERLKQHRHEIVALLTPGPCGWSAEDWLVFIAERAAIAEHNGGLSRGEAEALAYATAVAEWLDRTMPATAAGHCHYCSDRASGDTFVPLGVDNITWVHAACADAWRRARRAEAAAALAEIGIVPPTHAAEVAA